MSNFQLSPKAQAALSQNNPGLAILLAPGADALKTAAVAFLASRLALLLAGWLSLTYLKPGHPGWNAPGASWTQLLGLAFRWDSGWYMFIAQQGYSTISTAAQPYASNLAFWPAFPFLARFLAAATGMPILFADFVD